MIVAATLAALLAQAPGEVSGTTSTVGETPRNFTLEFKLGPYKPLIDSAPGLVAIDDSGNPDPVNGRKPYDRVFGDTPMLMGEIGLEYMIWQRFGTISAGVSVAYAEKFGKAIIADTGARAEQSTGLRLLTVRPDISYRFDVLAFRYKVPLVPYVKAQFVTMPWWVVNGGSLEYSVGDPAQGIAFGFAGTAGLSLMLDVLDHRLARDFDSSVGVNHTYLFAEFNFQEMVPFRKDATSIPLVLSSRHWMFGLAFDL